MGYAFGNLAEQHIDENLKIMLELQNTRMSIDNARRTIEGVIKAKTNLWHWLFLCRRTHYRHRIYHGLKRDKNLNVVKDKNGKVEFLETPGIGPDLQYFGLNDPTLYQKLLLNKLHPMYKEFIIMLGDGDEEKGKEVLKQKLIDDEYVLSTEAVEYARAKIFAELESDAIFLEGELADYEGKDNFNLRLPVTDSYFELGMRDKIDPEYRDKLVDSDLGSFRVDEWEQDAWSRDRAKIQIDFYCKKFLDKKKTEDRFVLFDNVSEDVIKPTDFKSLLTRYTPYIPTHIDLFEKYEVALWGATTDSGAID